MKKYRICIITGDEQRHLFFARTLSESPFLSVEIALYEKKANLHEKFEYSPEGRKIVDNHFKLRDESEKFYFGNRPKGKIGSERFIEKGKSNNPEIVNELTGQDYDAVLLYGSSIIKEPLLEYYKDKVINTHLGLSPYYRGSGTNFWALTDQLPECVGATIHLTTLEVDAGKILKQVRPDIGPSDNIHDVGNKTIIKAIEVLPFVVKDYLEGKTEPSGQDLSIGKVCKRKDLTPEDIQQVYKNFEEGMIGEYLQNKGERDLAYPVI